MNRVLHCFQALGMIKCIPLTWSKGQRSVREGWNWAKRQAWSHQLWFPKKGKGSLRVSVSFGRSLLVTTRASSSVCVAHSRKLKIRRRRRQKRQERCWLQVQHTFLPISLTSLQSCDVITELARIWVLGIHLRDVPLHLTKYVSWNI